MRLARRALVAVLTTLMLFAAVSAQTLKSENDPRNTAPTVGTGGTPGGPTGLFTIYDGQTLRKGEFTLSFAYSNYDRDPGNVDIVEIPVSVQIGLSDYLELFYNTDAYRGVKVNNPRNLSSFYLPNSQLRFGATQLGSGAAIILAPERVSGTSGIAGAVFRPAFNQSFVQFPFVGGVGPNFGLTGSTIAPPFTSRLGTPSGAESNFGAASNFPGVGSVFGSILPGVVLSTTTRAATLTTRAITTPSTFTLAPSYLADAPFVNRLYGESSFSTHSVGAKIRFTGPDNPFGIGVVPFYRFYLDKADDLSGFNQLQRGASPGGDLGDFGAVLFVDGRLSRSVNLSANIGYILNSNPQSEAFGGSKVSLLDRPDELVAGVGFDFPVNQFFQPIAELKAIRYMGGRTPNAFENHPVETLLGVRVYPRRFMGFSIAYRGHLNQQGDRGVLDFFGDDPSFPTGFTQSDDPHGFLAQFWIGRRNERSPAILPNQPPTVSLSAASSRVVLAATGGAGQQADPACTPTSQQVALSTQATDPDGDTLLYTYSTTGGTITGSGPNAALDLTGAQPGTYTVTVEVDDGCGCVAFSTTTVVVENCACITIPCPNVTVSCPDAVDQGQTATFTANLSAGDPNVTPTFNWSVSAGTITSGQGTSSIQVDTTGVTGPITATVNVGGYNETCQASATCTSNVRPTIVEERKVSKFDEYGNIRFNDEKARLDNFAIQLQNDPTARATIIAYGGRRGRRGEAQARANRARDYLVNTRGIDAGRIDTVDGGYREDLTVELYIVPSGATAPTPSATVQESEVQFTRGRAAPRRRSRRR
ncbi:MAG: PKD domain-containing protein [Pyrinomonadaceae bacterium]